MRITYDDEAYLINFDQSFSLLVSTFNSGYKYHQFIYYIFGDENTISPIGFPQLQIIILQIVSID